LSKSFKSGLHYREYRNVIKGALSLRFAHMPLIELMIVGTLNHRVPGSSRKPHVSDTAPNRAFLRGFPATQFPDFGLCGRPRILVAVFGALSPHPKIPFPAAVVEREVRTRLKPYSGFCAAVIRDLGPGADTIPD
jgi:hypothetical protein